MIMIDNSVLSFAFHLDNGIPILPYYNNKQDNELLFLRDHLYNLSRSDDFRLDLKSCISNESNVCLSNKKTKSKILLAPETDVNILKEKFMSLKNIMKKRSELNANINVIKDLKET